jgi:hypothetical protein
VYPPRAARRAEPSWGRKSPDQEGLATTWKPSLANVEETTGQLSNEPLRSVDREESRPE